MIRFSNLCFEVVGGHPFLGTEIGLWNGCDDAVNDKQHRLFDLSGYLKGNGLCTHPANNTIGTDLNLVATSCTMLPRT